MLESIFRAYDVRGRYPEELDEATVERIAFAFGKKIPGTLIVARDARTSSPQLFRSAVAGLRRAGTKKVIEVGIATTPMFYFLVNDRNADGGLMITASHNPGIYNGVKAVRRGAVPVNGKDMLKIVQRYV